MSLCEWWSRHFGDYARRLRQALPDGTRVRLICPRTCKFADHTSAWVTSWTPRRTGFIDDSDDYLLVREGDGERTFARRDVVDGVGPFEGTGPHYSRRTPGSKTFTGVGKEVVLVTDDGRAVWACVYQRTPSAKGTGTSRGRTGTTDAKPRYLWRNMMFRNLGAGLSSWLIQDATEETYRQWIDRYGALPAERLRTEIGVAEVKSKNPGYCYERAGWEPERDAKGKRIVRNGKLFLWAPVRP